MSNKEVSKYALEQILMHHTNIVKRLIIALIILAVLWFSTIAVFTYYLALPEDTYEVSVENDDGNANYIGNDMNGDINNGQR